MSTTEQKVVYLGMKIGTLAVRVDELHACVTELETEDNTDRIVELDGGKMADCCLETHPKFGGCCCKCRYQIKAEAPYRDPSVLRIPEGTWACIAFAFVEGEPIVYIGDFEHGMCELFWALPWPQMAARHFLTKTGKYVTISEEERQ